MAKVKALVIVGYGLNCEAETTQALTLAGAHVEQVHLNDLILGRQRFEAYQILALIGGFSFGDHISAGKAFANRLRCRLSSELGEFIAREKLIICICKGFQTMVKLGLLPGFDGDYTTQRITLVTNESGVFRNAWVHLRVDPDSKCVFTRGIGHMEMPVRHGEGKLYLHDEKVLEKLKSQGQVVLRYAHPETDEPTMEFPHNPNGSMDAIAGVCDPTGRIFGLMPHPEAFTSPMNHPHWIRQRINGILPKEGAGLKIFRNAVEYLNS